MQYTPLLPYITMLVGNMTTNPVDLGILYFHTNLYSGIFLEHSPLQDALDIYIYIYITIYIYIYIYITICILYTYKKYFSVSIPGILMKCLFVGIIGIDAGRCWTLSWYTEHASEYETVEANIMPSTWNVAKLH